MFRDESECERESYYFNQPVIKIFFFFFAFMNSTHLFLDVYCSSGAKIFRFNSTAGASF